MNKVLNLAKVLTLALVLSIGLSYAYAWTAPAQNPPLGNVSAPINTSSTAQTKSGNLTVGTLTAASHCIGTNCITSWPTGGGGSYTDTDTLTTVMNRGNVAPLSLNMNNNSITGVSNLSASVINDNGALSVGGAAGFSQEFYQSPGNYFRIPGPFSPIKGASSYGDGKVLTSDAAGYATWQTPAGVGIPAGAVMYFNLVSCPSGWLPADGTSGNPDLRGEFIRGLDNGRGVDSGRVLGSAQVDMFASHTHTTKYMQGGAVVNSAAGTSVGPNGTQTSSATGGTETRPRNVALLACIKS